jgi:hypothetical protein
MLKVHLGGQRVFGLGVSFRPKFPPQEHDWYTDIGWSNDFRPGWLTDPLPKLGALDAFIGFYTAEQLLGCTGSRSALILGRSKPRAIRVYDAGEDWRWHGSILEGLKHLGQDSQPTDERWYRDSELKHASARGEVMPGGEVEDVYGRFLLPEQHFPLFRYGGTDYDFHSRHPYLEMEEGQLSRLSSQTDPDWWNAGSRFLFQDLKCLTTISDQSAISFTQDDGYARNTHVLTAFSWDESFSDSTRLTLRYRYGNLATVTSPDWVRDGDPAPVSQSWYDVEWNVEFYGILPRAVHPWQPGKHLVEAGVFCTLNIEYRLRSITASVDLGDYVPWPTADGSVPIDEAFVAPQILKTGLCRKTSSAFWELPGKSVHEKDEIVTKYRDYIRDSVHPYLVHACSLSSNSCLDSVVLPSNWLESVPELPSLLKSVSKVGEFANIVRRILDLDPKAIPAFIDFLAGAHLLYKYGAKPAVSDVQNARLSVERAVEQMTVLSQGLPDHLYGEFKYNIPEHPDGLPGRQWLVSRTKMVLRKNLGIALLWLLALDQSGLLPSMARVWDLVPFSFVIDWFTKLSDRFGDVDRMLERAFIDPDYYVHSFTYTLQLDNDFIYPYRSLSGNPPQLRYFIRERSRHSHYFGNTGRFDLRPPTGLQHGRQYTAASLIWVMKP